MPNITRKHNLLINSYLSIYTPVKMPGCKHVIYYK